jgi:hypothetical protein
MPQASLTHSCAKQAQGCLARPADCHTKAAASCHGRRVATVLAWLLVSSVDHACWCGAACLGLCEGLEDPITCALLRARVSQPGEMHAGAWAATYAAEEQGTRSGVASEPVLFIIRAANRCLLGPCCVAPVVVRRLRPTRGCASRSLQQPRVCA